MIYFLRGGISRIILFFDLVLYLHLKCTVFLRLQCLPPAEYDGARFKINHWFRSLSQYILQFPHVFGKFRVIFVYFVFERLHVVPISALWNYSPSFRCIFFNSVRALETMIVFAKHFLEWSFTRDSAIAQFASLSIDSPFATCLV